MQNSKSVFSSVIWKFGERISGQLVSFVVSVVLARLLSPEDYGVVTLTMVFITICSVFVSSGFGMALIQKREISKLDYSTVFIFGLLLSVFLYILLFYFAPVISSFYNQPILTYVLRVMALQLPFASIQSVQQAYIARNMMFKKLCTSTLIGTILSAVIGISFAYLGFGVWSLVFQTLSLTIINVIILSIVINKKIQLSFSFSNFKDLFSFSGQILCSDLLHTVYTQLRSLIIGKRYSTSSLAYYSKGQQIPYLFVTNISVAIASVLFPAMSRCQEDLNLVKKMLRKSMCVGLYIMLPIMAELIAISRPFIIILLGHKWLPAVPFMQLACFEYAFDSWNQANQQATKAQGRSGAYLKMEFLKKTVAIIMLFISIPFGVYAIAFSGALYGILAVYFSTLSNKKSLNYGFLKQFMDCLPILLINLVMFVIVYSLNFFNLNSFILIFLQVVVGLFIYIFLSVITRNESYYILKNLVFNILERKK